MTVVELAVEMVEMTAGLMVVWMVANTAGVKVDEKEHWSVETSVAAVAAWRAAMTVLLLAALLVASTVERKVGQMVESMAPWTESLTASQKACQWAWTTVGLKDERMDWWKDSTSAGSWVACSVGLWVDWMVASKDAWMVVGKDKQGAVGWVDLMVASTACERVASMEDLKGMQMAWRRVAWMVALMEQTTVRGMVAQKDVQRVYQSADLMGRQWGLWMVGSMAIQMEKLLAVSWANMKVAMTATRLAMMMEF